MSREEHVPNVRKVIDMEVDESVPDVSHESENLDVQGQFHCEGERGKNGHALL